jgi:hypothetical protein
VGSIPTRLTLETLVVVREIGGVLRDGERSRRLRQQTVSKRSGIFRSDPCDGVAQIVDREVAVGIGRRRHGRVPQDPLDAVRVDAGA